MTRTSQSKLFQSKLFQSKSLQSEPLQSEPLQSKPLQSKSSRDRLLRQAQRDRDRAMTLPPGAERDALVKKASQAETAAHIDEWLSSPGLRPPK